MTVRVGVIGCGVQGSHHVRAYRGLADVQLVAICDSDPARLEITGNEFGVANRYTDYQQMLTAHRFDLLSVCTMPATHCEIAVAALEAGAHVLCEKPFARSSAEAGRMATAAQRAGRFLTIGFNMRYMPAAQALKQFVDEGRLGRMLYAHAWTLATDIPWWGKHYVKSISGGGVLASTVVHILDLALWIGGAARPVTASASMTRVFPRKRAVTAPSPEAAASYDVEDMLSGHVRFADGSWMTVQGGWCWDRPDYSYSFEIVGDAAAIQFDPMRVVAEHDGVPREQALGVPNERLHEAVWPRSVRDQIADVVAAVREQREPLVKLDQALTVQKLIDALYESAELGREVTL